MGANQGTPTDPSSITNSVANDIDSSNPVFFDCHCNSHVAEYIHHEQRYRDELNTEIQAYAKVIEIQFLNSHGIITVKANPVSTCTVLRSDTVGLCILSVFFNIIYLLQVNI